MASFSFLGLYKKRFKSSWMLFTKVFLGLFIGTLLCVTFVYIFRLGLGAFPTSVFVISFFINLLLIFKVNQFILKHGKRIKKQVVIIGNGEIDDIINKRPGQYLAGILHHVGPKYDTGYSGLDLFLDGTFVSTTYGVINENDLVFLYAPRLKITDLDSLAGVETLVHILHYI